MRSAQFLALALLGLSACGEVRKKIATSEARAQAASAKTDQSRAKKKVLEQERAELAKKVAAVDERSRKARLELHRMLAAADPLKAAIPGSLANWDTAAAGAGARLDAAAAAHDLPKVAEVVGDALKETWPCASAGGADAADQPCESRPYEDPCAGVSARMTPRIDWSCQSIAKVQGAPPLVFCSGAVEYPGDSPEATDGLETLADLARTGFAFDGKLWFSDWPPPTPETYFPPNTVALQVCNAELEQRRCEHECEVRYEKWQDPCAQHTWGDGGGDFDPYAGVEEDPAVRQARLDAERAEAEAREAEERARQARLEVGYQECLTSCRPRPDPIGEAVAPSDAEAEAAPSTPKRVVRTLKFVESPAPGVLLVEADTLRYRETVVLGVETETLLLSNDELVEAFSQGKVEGEPKKLGALGTLAVLQDARAPEVAKAHDLKGVAAGPRLARGKLEQGPFLAGLSFHGAPVAWIFSSAKGADPAKPMPEAELCAAVAGRPADFGEAAAGLSSACERATKAAVELKDLEEKIATVTTFEGLQAWDQARNASAVLFAPQKTSLAGPLATRRQALSKEALEPLKARLETLEPGEPLKEWLAARDASKLLIGSERSELDKLYEKKKPDLAKAELAGLKERLAKAEDSAGLEELRAGADASTLLSRDQKASLEAARKKRKAELKAACKLSGPDACPDAATGGTP